MRKLLIAIALCSLFCIPVLAQDTPAVEVYGGYQLLHHGSGMVGEYSYDSYNLNGFIAAVEGNVKPWLGIVGEFGYNTKSWGDGIESESFTTYLFGPRISYRTGNFRVFGHYLLGGTHYKDEYDVDPYAYTETQNPFTQAIGGGIDISLGKHISIRPAQIDMLGINWSDEWENMFRYSVGAVVKF